MINIPKSSGRLTYIGPGKRKYYVVCKCACGTVKETYASNYARGKTLSCGCFKYDGHARRTHGKSKTPIYRLWNTMVMRCHNKNSAGFQKYGAKGVTVCERWRTFENFYADMGERPTKAHSLDRIQNSLGYSPSNCRWALPKVQMRNTSSNRHIRFQGDKKTLAEWCEIYKQPYPRVLARLRLGWPVKDALTCPRYSAAPR